MLGWELDQVPLALVDAPDLVVATVNSPQSTLSREVQPEGVCRLSAGVGNISLLLLFSYLMMGHETGESEKQKENKPHRTIVSLGLLPHCESLPLACRPTPSCSSSRAEVVYRSEFPQLGNFPVPKESKTVPAIILPSLACSAVKLCTHMAARTGKEILISRTGISHVLFDV